MASDSPRTRDLAKLVDALETVEDELSFQVKRLNEMVVPRTEQEAVHLAALKESYEKSRPVIRTLKRYHEGRLERQRSGETHTPDQGITEDGVAVAFFDEEVA